MVLLAIGMTVFTVVTLYKGNTAQPSLLGFQAMIVRSDSMRATDFAAGDIILVRAVDPASLQVGDIIAFTSSNTGSEGETVTHKIGAITTTAQGEPAFATYGTTTGVTDEALVTYSQVLGQYIFRLPSLGRFFAFIKTKQGYFFCIFLPFLALIIYRAVRCVLLYQQYKAEQRRALQRARERRAEEQRRMAAMRRQLQADSHAPPSAHNQTLTMP
jgi:signal peptidase I